MSAAPCTYTAFCAWLKEIAADDEGDGYAPPQRARVGWRYAGRWYLRGVNAYRAYREQVREAHLEAFGVEASRFLVRVCCGP